MQVDMGSQDGRKFLLEIEEGEPRNVAWLELRQYIHVTVRPEVVPQYRAEERQPPHMVALAELGDLALVDGNSRSHATLMLAAVGSPRQLASFTERKPIRVDGPRVRAAAPP